jgi:hypothetical protein
MLGPAVLLSIASTVPDQCAMFVEMEQLLVLRSRRVLATLESGGAKKSRRDLTARRRFNIKCR